MTMMLSNYSRTWNLKILTRMLSVSRSCKFFIFTRKGTIVTGTNIVNPKNFVVSQCYSQDRSLTLLAGLMRGSGGRNLFWTETYCTLISLSWAFQQRRDKYTTGARSLLDSTPKKSTRNWLKKSLRSTEFSKESRIFRFGAYSLTKLENCLQTQSDGDIK